MNKIFLDLDMTLNDMSYVWCRHLGIKPLDVEYFGWVRDAIGLEADAWWAQPGVYDNILPLPGSQEFVNKLQHTFEVKIITHTHGGQNPSEKDKWIKTYFGLSKEDIIHAGEKWHHTRGAILVDDCPRHVLDHMRINDGKGIIFNHNFDYGWAKPLKSPVQVISSYKELYNAVSLMS
jgi:5'(3')-deoxyribonucleotidase